MDEPADTGGIRDDKGRFLPGVSGNPNGRPEGSVSIMTKIRQKFQEDPELFDAYVAEVLADPKLRTEIIRQLDGAPRQNIGLDGGADGEPIRVEVSEKIAEKNGL
jgi:hypothetical protein